MTNGMFFYLFGVCVNALVHTFMYWSYFRTAIGKPPVWKSILTLGQIIQFMWGLLCFIPWPKVCGYSYTEFKGPIIVFWFNQFVLLSFFFLFISLYLKRYSKPKTKQE